MRARHEVANVQMAHGTCRDDVVGVQVAESGVSGRIMYRWMRRRVEEPAVGNHANASV